MLHMPQPHADFQFSMGDVVIRLDGQATEVTDAGPSDQAAEVRSSSNTESDWFGMDEFVSNVSSMQSRCTSCLWRTEGGMGLF